MANTILVRFARKVETRMRRNIIKAIAANTEQLKNYDLLIQCALPRELQNAQSANRKSARVDAWIMLNAERWAQAGNGKFRIVCPEENSNG